MNSLNRLHQRITVTTFATKCFQVIHNGTLATACFLIEFQRFGRAKKFSSVLVLEANQLAAFPVIGIARHNPIVTAISLAVSFTIGCNFLLLGENGFDTVRMQIAVGVGMCL